MLQIHWQNFFALSITLAVDFEGISKLFINIITSYLKGFCEPKKKNSNFFHVNKILRVWYSIINYTQCCSVDRQD